jgi:RimJ/RimL family protein N-acetyltransferase
MEDSPDVSASPEVDVSFRRLTDADLPVLHGWLNEPGVARWWEGEDLSREGVAGAYGSANSDPTEHWIASTEEGDLGWIELYRLLNSPEDLAQWEPMGVLQSAAGIDYLIGDPADRGRGLGAAMIRSFSDQVVFGMHPEVGQVCAAPYATNVGSCRALASAGFRLLGPVEESGGTTLLMLLER